MSLDGTIPNDDDRGGYDVAALPSGNPVLL